MTRPTAHTSLLATLSGEYAHAWTGGGDARWLRYAWQGLADAGHVPIEIPDSGPGAADARVRLAALALLSTRFHAFGDPSLDEVVDVRDGEAGVRDDDLLAWLETEGITPWAIEEAHLDGLDPDESAPIEARFEDVVAAVLQVSSEVQNQYAALRTHTELFAELSVQSFPAGGDPEGDEYGLRSVYPLDRAAVALVLSDPSGDDLTRFDWLGEHLTFSH